MQSVDQAIGARIRTYRKALGLSQTDLAERIGVRFQQVQKYESGVNRIAASRLWRIADALGISVVRLFENIETKTEIEADTYEMLDLFRRLPPAAQAQALFQMRALDARYGVTTSKTRAPNRAMKPHMQLIDLANTPGKEPDFLAQLHHICHTLGLEYASYASANPISGKVHAFTTYPDSWKDHYMAQKLHLVDPTLTTAARSVRPVDWRRLEHDQKFQSVFNQAHDFNLPSTGLTVPVRGPMGDIGLFSVTAGLSAKDWKMLTGQVIGQLQTAAVHLHDTVMHSDPLTRLLRQPQLSTRELEVLQWVAAGKSQLDIGDILSISSRTVEVHLRSAREKLNTLTTAQAVGRAVSLGMIEPG